MSQFDSDKDDVENLPIPVDSVLTFARKNDLQKVLRKIDKSVDKSIEFLEKVMLNENNDLKLRVDCAKTILDKKVQISESVSKDQLSRTVAESRLIMARQAVAQKQIKQVTPSDDEDEDNTPMYLPTVLLDVSNINKM